jgi:predicted metal-dependent hydrolase
MSFKPIIIETFLKNAPSILKDIHDQRIQHGNETKLSTSLYNMFAKLSYNDLHSKMDKLYKKCLNEQEKQQRKKTSEAKKKQTKKTSKTTKKQTKKTSKTTKKQTKKTSPSKTVTTSQP